MKINILLSIIFISAVFLAFSGNYRDSDLIGCTELNGNGCVCHNLEESPEVLVWVEGPDTLLQGQTGMYRMYMAGGPAIAGGYNVAVKNGVLTAVDSLSHWDYRVPYELTQAFPLPFANILDTIYWDFAFTAADLPGTDTIYSCGLSTNWDSIPDFHDLWAFGPKYPVTILHEVPVELISFTAEPVNGFVELKWSTATEINNSGFILQRSENKSDWQEISFVKGSGNSTSRIDYSFSDFPAKQSDYFYRLKQTDFNGSFEYSAIISVQFNTSEIKFALEQNYPNPFNPLTTIKYSIPPSPSGSSLTVLKIFDIMGKEIAVLVNEEQAPGEYQIDFNAASLASNVYLYSLTNGEYSITKKLVLLK